MIVVIDDRATRMRGYLGERVESEHPRVRLLKEDQDIDAFIAFLRNKAPVPEILQQASTICVHSSTFFSNDSAGRSFFENWCSQQQKALVSFSGGNAGVHTLVPGLLYASDAKTLYRRIALFMDGSINDLHPDVFLMGEQFLLNQLLQLRRSLFLFTNKGDLQEITDEQSMYSNEIICRVFTDWVALGDLAPLEKWLDIINRQIEKAHGN